jgi:hypothetical protein
MAGKDIKATLTFDGKSVAMADNPAAENLIKDIITQRFPELKGGKMPIGVRIEIKRVEAINLKPKEDKIMITMEAWMSPGDMARLRHLSGQGVPVSAVFESPQAEFDLVVYEVDLKTGESVHNKELIPAGAPE